MGLYRGEMLAGKANGEGEWVSIEGFSKGMKYIGKWKNDKMEGHCKRYESDGVLNYNGGYLQGKRSG
jgi:hypothetical protein